jgi:hypothetical protein
MFRETVDINRIFGGSSRDIQVLIPKLLWTYNEQNAITHLGHSHKKTEANLDLRNEATMQILLPWFDLLIKTSPNKSTTTNQDNGSAMFIIFFLLKTKATIGQASVK